MKLELANKLSKMKRELLRLLSKFKWEVTALFILNIASWLAYLLVFRPQQGHPGPPSTRLPANLWPLHYELFVEPHLQESHLNFSSRVAIRMEVREATDRIVLHGGDKLNLGWQTLSLRAVSNETNTSSTVPEVKDTYRYLGSPINPALVIKLDGFLEVGKEYVLAINFTGDLNEMAYGFHKIPYKHSNSDQITWIAATGFDFNKAQQAFPCFDEPMFKATFSIQIKHWKNMTALSNMPIVGSEDSPDGLWVTDTFAKTPRMSTYLVAYAVTDFESRRLGNISVWTRPGFVHKADYALQTAGKILRFYEDYFGIKVPLPKMDMIALPAYQHGAMANWGLITFRETSMLYDEKSSSLANKQAVAQMVARELAQQWFGDLVTPKWWDDTWLGKGFASYLQYIGTNHVEPQWKILDHSLLEADNPIPAVHEIAPSKMDLPISLDINGLEEMYFVLLNPILNVKSASIIRMMENFLSEPVLRNGLQRYLRELSYNNADQSDLWRHLADALRLAGQNQTSQLQHEGDMVNVERVMNSWTKQPGLPLVTLTRRYGGSRTAEMEQALFNVYNGATDEQKWEIPITYTWESEQDWRPRTKLWMSQNASSLELQLPQTGDDEWVLLNVDDVGYYRVNYDERNWRLLIRQLEEDHTKIGVINRAQVLDNLFVLARFGAVDYKLALDASMYLRKERHYLPWKYFSRSFKYIDLMLQRQPIYGDWKDYQSYLIEPQYARYIDTDWTTNSMGLNDTQELDNMVSVISFACEVNEHCIRKASQVFQEWRKSGRNEINPNLRYIAYCTAIRNGNKNDWNFLWQAYEKEEDLGEKDAIMHALVCSREHWILAKLLEWAHSNMKLSKLYDEFRVFFIIFSNKYGREILFDFIREHWSASSDDIHKLTIQVIANAGLFISSELELDQLVSLHDSNRRHINGPIMDASIDSANLNIAWIKRNYNSINNWLQAARATIAPAKSQTASSN